jgi:hypothetical protein
MALRLRLLSALGLAAIAFGGGAAVARAGTCWSGYSYAGVQNPSAAYGVSATLTMVGTPTVTSGHVAAWVGVGGPGLGPGGKDEWLQAGIAHEAGGDDALYYEVKRPDDASAQYVTLGSVSVGESHRIAVVERAGQRDSWRVLLDGIQVGPALALPGSHGSFAPVATAETWDGGAATCNRYAYDFKDLAVAGRPGGSWQPFGLAHVLRDPAYRLTLRSSGFTASSR